MIISNNRVYPLQFFYVATAMVVLIYRGLLTLTLRHLFKNNFLQLQIKDIVI